MAKSTPATSKAAAALAARAELEAQAIAASTATASVTEAQTTEAPDLSPQGETNTPVPEAPRSSRAKPATSKAAAALAARAESEAAAIAASTVTVSVTEAQTTGATDLAPQGAISTTVLDVPRTSRTKPATSKATPLSPHAEPVPTTPAHPHGPGSASLVRVTSVSSTIQVLTPELKDWTLLGRVLCRSPIRTWKNLRGHGSVFDFRIIDMNGDTIKASVFAAGVDMFDSILCNGATCSFSGGRVKPCDLKYSTDPNELVFDHRATIVVSTPGNVPDTLAIPTSSIQTLRVAPVGSKVSIAGIVHALDPPKRFVTSYGETRFKRDLLLIDKSLSKVVVTLWGYLARQDSSEYIGKPAVVRSATVNDYQGQRSLSALGGSSVLFDPALQVSIDLKSWYANAPDEGSFSFVPTPDSN